MDSFYFENKKEKFLDLRGNEKSIRKLIFSLNQIINELFEQNDIVLIEVYLIEFTGYLIPLLKQFSVFGIHPEKSQSVLSNIEKIKPFIKEENYLLQLTEQYERIKCDLENLKLALNGKKFKGKLLFPVVEKSNENSIEFGTIEQLNITISQNKKNEKTEFIITPSLPVIESKLKEQLDKSWIFALNFVKEQYKVFDKNFLITVQFVNKLGIYEGNSLGIALTIGFIQELFRFYDLREIISFNDDIIVTGSMDDEGNILNVGEEILKSKTQIVFFSTASKFIIPFEEYKFTEVVWTKLKSQFPNRNLEIITVKKLNDIINRRDIIKIDKKNLITWIWKKIYKSKILLLTIIFIFIARLFFFLISIDNNPYKLEVEKDHFIVKNISGEILWTKKSPSIKYIIERRYFKSEKFLSSFGNIFDIDDDGTNEVLLTNSEMFAPLTMYNYKGEKIWEYFHYDSIETKNEKFTGRYGITGIIDTINEGGTRTVIIWFQHNNYYPNGIMKLNMLTGKPNGKILWHPGGLVGAVLNDFNNDGIKEIIAGGISNGMHRAFLFSIDHNKLEGTFPTNENYKFLNMKTADFNNYILFPLTDIGKLYFDKYNAVSHEPLIEGNKIRVTINEGSNDIYKNKFWYGVEFNKNLTPTHILIGDNASVDRDRLVKNGKLKYPLTDTFEFRKIIMNKIEFWNGEKFVKFFAPNKNINEKE